MANQALARPGAIMLDPFVGTGSILVSCGHFQSVCFGTDIDWLVLHGKTKGATANVMDNFRQYKLPLPELICHDNSCPVWRGDEWVDGIACDPPYGVRAGARKTGKKPADSDGGAAAADTKSDSKSQKQSKSNKTKPPKTKPAAAAATASDSAAAADPKSDDAKRSAAAGAAIGSGSGGSGSGGGAAAGSGGGGIAHGPIEGVLSSGYTPLGLGNGVVYPVEDVMTDLLALSARLLRVGGRLVYLLPTTTAFKDEELPTHPCLIRTAVSEQLLRVGFSRRLVTMTKIIPYDPIKHAPAPFDPTAPPKPLPSYADMHSQILGDKTGKRGLTGARLEKRQRREAKLAARTEQLNAAAKESGQPLPAAAANSFPNGGAKRSEEEKKAYRATLRKQKKLRRQNANHVLVDAKREKVTTLAAKAKAAAAAQDSNTAPNNFATAASAVTSTLSSGAASN